MGGWVGWVGFKWKNNKVGVEFVNGEEIDKIRENVPKIHDQRSSQTRPHTDRHKIVPEALYTVHTKANVQTMEKMEIFRKINYSKKKEKDTVSVWEVSG